MKEINLLTYWQYDVNSEEFSKLLNKLNIKACTCLSEKIKERSKDSRITSIYLYNNLQYFNNARITYELDDDILKKMTTYEPTAMDIVNRWRRSYSTNESYREIKSIYYTLLRFWNNYILTNNINLLVLTIMPHIPNTYIPYALCKIYGIPTIMQGVIPFSRGKKINYILKPSIENVDEHWNKRYEEMKLRYVDCDKESIRLSEELERYFVQYDISKKGKDNVIFYNEKNRIKDVFHKYWSRIRIYIRRKDYKILGNKVKYLLTTRSETHFFLKKIDQMEEEVDLNKKFYFFALHLQPEATTLPNGGVFADQLLAIRLLAKNLPNDTYLYVKEHPSYWIQKGRLESVYESRNFDFYEEIKSLKNVKLIKHTYSSQELLKKALGVVTITGTVGFEALFLGKPVLVFGHTFYERYPYAFSVKTDDDCKKAMLKIQNSEFKFEERQMKIYLKSLEKYIVPLGANEKNFTDNGTPKVDAEDREKICEKITTFYQEYYS